MPFLDQAIRVLEAELPPVTLLLGPLDGHLPALAVRLAWHHGVHRADLITVRPPLTADMARHLAAQAGVAPFGPFKAVVAVLDGAGEQAQNILLKVLEEPPPSARFLLAASESPLDTIVSRARVFRFGSQAPAAPGVSDARSKAAAAVRAALSGDLELFIMAFSAWDKLCGAGCPAGHRAGQHYLEALREWAASQGRRYRPELFPGEYLEPEVPAAQARRVLAFLAEFPRARPGNAAFRALHLAFFDGWG